MKHFTHVHSSSRYDRSVESLEQAIEDYIGQGSLVTFTEVAAPERERPLKEVPGWGAVTGDHAGRDDAGIIFDRSVWKLIHSESRIVYDTIGAVYAVLEHIDTGNLLLVSVLHLPASVEGPGGFERNSIRGIQWVRAHRNWKRQFRSIAKQFRVDGILLVADWNLNVKRKIFLPLWKALHPRMQLVFSFKNVPLAGTHHNRWIDFSFIRGKLRVIRWPWLLKDDNSSDHRPYAETFGWV